MLQLLTVTSVLMSGDTLW